MFTHMHIVTVAVQNTSMFMHEWQTLGSAELTSSRGCTMTCAKKKKKKHIALYIAGFSYVYLGQKYTRLSSCMDMQPISR